MLNTIFIYLNASKNIIFSELLINFYYYYILFFLEFTLILINFFYITYFTEI